MAEPQDTQATDQTEAPDPSTSLPDEAADLLAAAKAAFDIERADLRDRLIRSLADLENLRKRSEKDRREAAIYGGQKLARDMLSVFDNLSRALSLLDDDLRQRAPGLADGLDLTLRDLTNIFARHGIEKISPQPGDPFDPHLHEAMFEAPVPNFAAGQIVQVVSEGFRLHEHLLRAAQVGISSTPR